MRRLVPILAAVAACFLFAACSTNDYTRARLTAGGPVSVTVARVTDGQEAAPYASYRGEAGATVTAQTTKPYFTFDGQWTELTPASAPQGSILFRSTPKPAPQPAGAAPLGRIVTHNGITYACMREDAAATSGYGAGDPNAITLPMYGTTYVCLPAPSQAPASAPKAASGTGWAPSQGSDAGPASACAPAASQPAPLAAQRACGTPVYLGCDGTPGGHSPAPGGSRQVIAPGTGWPCSAPQAPRLGGPAKALLLPVGLVGCLVKGMQTSVMCFLEGSAGL